MGRLKLLNCLEQIIIEFIYIFTYFDYRKGENLHYFDLEESTQQPGSQVTITRKRQLSSASSPPGTPRLTVSSSRSRIPRLTTDAASSAYQQRIPRRQTSYSSTHQPASRQHTAPAGARPPTTGQHTTRAAVHKPTPAQHTTRAAVRKPTPAQHATRAAVHKPTPAQHTTTAGARKPTPAQHTTPTDVGSPTPGQHTTPAGVRKPTLATTPALVREQTPRQQVSKRHTLTVPSSVTSFIPRALASPSNIPRPTRKLSSAKATTVTTSSKRQKLQEHHTNTQSADCSTDVSPISSVRKRTGASTTPGIQMVGIQQYFLTFTS